MFWADNHVVSVSINTLLEKENVTLKELLDEEDILQECKSSNKQLVEFLVRPSTIYELIQLIVEEPPDNIDLRQRYKHSSIASEIIASRVAGLNDNIAKEPKIMEKLYSFLDGKPPLNPLLASYFSKAIDVLFTHSSGHQDWYTYQFRSLHVVEYFKSCPDFLPKFLNHLGTSGILNSLQYITHFIDNGISHDILNWLDSQQLIEKLIALICGTYIPVIYVSDKPSNTCIEVKPQPSEHVTQQPNDNNTEPNEKHPASANVETSPQPSSDMQPEATTEKPDAGESQSQCASQIQSGDNCTSVTEGSSESSSMKDDVSPVKKELSLEGKGDASAEQSSESLSQEQNICSEQVKEEEKSNVIVDQQVVSEGRSVENANELTNGPLEEIKIVQKSDVISEKYIERIESSRSANASELISSFITRGRDNIGQGAKNPLFTKCISEGTIFHLLESMFSAPASKKKNALLNGIQVILVLLNDKTGVIQPPELLPEELCRITNVVKLYIPHFLQVLKNPPEEKMVQKGVLKKAVGSVRLSVAHLFMVLVESAIDTVAADLMQHNVFNILLDMFFEYDFNNFLHSSVESIVCGALKASDEAVLRSHLFYDCKLLERLNEAWDKSENIVNTRPGYMGHVIQIVSLINQYDMGSSLANEEAEMWQLLKNKLHRAMANQNMVLGSIHDDSDEHLTNLREYTAEDQDLLDIVMRQISNDFDEVSNQLFTKMCINRNNPTMDSWTLNMLNSYSHKDQYLGEGSSSLSHDSYFNLCTGYVEDDDEEPVSYLNDWVVDKRPDWSGTNDAVFEDDGISGVIPNVDVSSSPWNDVASDGDIQSGWADFGNLQETAGISTVPNTFTCEAFAASQQDDSFGLRNEDKFLDDFGDFRSPTGDSNIQRLQQIQADTTGTSTLVVDKPLSFDQQFTAPQSPDSSNQQQLLHNDASALPTEITPSMSQTKSSQDVRVLSDSLAQVALQDPGLATVSDEKGDSDVPKDQVKPQPDAQR